jgi:hypothetical protein
MNGIVDVPHAKQAALRRAVGVLKVSSVQMQSPSSLSQVSIRPKPVRKYVYVRVGCVLGSVEEEGLVSSAM